MDDFEKWWETNRRGLHVPRWVVRAAFEAGRASKPDYAPSIIVDHSASETLWRNRAEGMRESAAIWEARALRAERRLAATTPVIEAAEAIQRCWDANPHFDRPIVVEKRLGNALATYRAAATKEEKPNG